jgi:bacillolysin
MRWVSETRGHGAETHPDGPGVLRPADRRLSNHLASAVMMNRTRPLPRRFAGMVGFTILIVPSARSAPPVEVVTFHSNTKQRITFVLAPNGKALAVARTGQDAPDAVDAIEQYGHALGVTNARKQLAAKRKWTDRFRSRHTSLAQTHNGIPVFSGVVHVHQDKHGDFLSANGDFHLIDPSLETRPKLSIEQAVSVASTGLEYTSPIVSKSDLVIVDPGWYGDPTIGAHLAYHITIHDVESLGATAFFVDAHAGKILDQWSLLHTARFRRIFDGAQKSELPGVLVRSEGDPPTQIPADADQAYDYAGDVYGFLSRALDRDSVDDASLPLTLTVNSGFSGCPNAFWSARLFQSAFCEGTASDDIVAHELGHALTLYTAGLIFQNQPGQLNESFSDVLGELVDLYNGNVSRIGPPGGTTWPAHSTGGGRDEPNWRRTSCTGAPDFLDGVRWLVGEDATAFGGALRDMWDPTCKSLPDRTGSKFYICPAVNNGGTHIGSSVVNHAFAMLVDGKEFNGFTIEAIGPAKATAVWFRAQSVYLTVASNFEDAYFAFGQSARDMIGSMHNDPRTGEPTGVLFTAFDAEQVENALRATEMNRTGICGVQQPLLDPSPGPVCASRTVLFQENFETDASGWSFENSGPPTPYDWEVTSAALPSQRTGTALFCADRHIGDCATGDESATHYAISPLIEVPTSNDTPMLSFAHFVATEAGVDGGNVSVSVNGEPWQTVEANAFLFNPYNARIPSASLENTNPLAGQLAWSGAGGGWGTTLIDLGGLVAGGDTLRIRFNFGKDLCIGSDGWYVDDVEVFTCGDCNRNGFPDGADFRFTTIAFSKAIVGNNQPVSLMVSPVPRASSDVTLTMYAIADLNDAGETLTVFVNGVNVGVLYGAEGDARDCPAITDRAKLVIPRDVFNALRNGDGLAIDVVASRDVSPSLCAEGTALWMLIDYAPETTDEDNNQIPDECENCSVPDAPTPQADSVSKNRFVSFVPPRTERQTALRLKAFAMPTGFEAHIGQPYWIAEPFRPVTDGDVVGAVGVVGYSRLSCDPVFTDWNGYDLVHVGDALVVPGAMFELQAIDLACFGKSTMPPGIDNEDSYTAPLSLRTVTEWGDLIGTDATQPPGNGPNVGDLAVMVDTLRGAGTVIGRTRADLIPAIPDLRITVFEVVAIVDAILSSQYPYNSPNACE